MNHIDSVSKALEAADRVNISVIRDMHDYYIDTPSEQEGRNVTIAFCTKEGAERGVDICLFDERDEVSAFKANGFKAAISEYTRLCKQEGVTADLMAGYVLDVYFAALEDRQSFIDNILGESFIDSLLG
jgi:hypothetical protein